MGNAINKSDFGFLGIDYQYKLVKIFIEDPQFFQEISPLVNQNVFTEPILKIFVGTLKDYFKKYGVVPSYEVIKLVLNEKASNQTEIDEFSELINTLKRTSFEGNEFVKENALKFFKQQEMIKAANKLLKLVGTGNIDKYDECKKIMDDAILIGQEDDLGCSPYDLLDQAMTKNYKWPIPTGISKLDEALNGGLDKGKIGLIIGSAGFGKSTFSTAIASYASTCQTELNNFEGYKVLQIYFEDDDVDIARKHFSRITQVEARKLASNQAETQEIRAVIENYEGKELMKKNLRIKRFNTSTKSASDIEAYIKRQINSGFRPDLVIIDYFECLLPEKGGYSTDSEWSREGRTMRKIENIAKDLNIAIWVPTQGNKGSINSPDVVTMDQAGGSIRKVQVAQVVISIARSIEDIDNSKATLAVLKNRSGKSGLVFRDIKFDNGRSTISCDEVKEYDSAKAYHEDMKIVEQQQLTKLARTLSSKNDLVHQGIF